MLGRSASPIIGPAQRQRPIYPSQAGCGRDKNISIVQAEKRMPLINDFQNVLCASRWRIGLAEFLETQIHPIEKQKLLLKFIFSRRDHLVEVIFLPQLFESRIFK